jgi:hypothetical protein
MRTSMTNPPAPVSYRAFDSAPSDCKLAETQEIRSASRVNSDYLYQAATIAAAILVLMSI